MFGAVARNAAGQNFSAFSGETAELCRVFVVNFFNFVDAKRANLSARAPTSFSAHIQTSLKRGIIGIDWLAAEVVVIILPGRSTVASAERIGLTRLAV